MGILLPREKSEIINRNPKRLVIYSRPKVGKTTELSKLDNCLLLDLEQGARHVSAMKIEVESLEHLYNIGEKIKEEGKPYKYIAVDNLSVLESWAEQAATKKYKESIQGKRFTGSSVLELANGAGYLPHRITMRKWLDYLTSLADHIIFVAHVKDILIDKSGIEVSAQDLDLVGKVKNIVCSDADAVGYMYRENTDGEDRLMINFQSSESLVCGARNEHLKGLKTEFSWDKIYID